MSINILALDQGTTSSRSIIFNQDSEIVTSAHKEFRQIFPKPGWVEHDPEEIWQTQYDTIKACLGREQHISAIGITNQRETTVLWDITTGRPIYNAIVWQDRRTASLCEKLKRNGYHREIKQRTGLEVDSYFSATKVAWILDNIKGARKLAEKGALAFGTIDTWLIWKLTHGLFHITDPSNASRTMLFNINKGNWDDRLCKLFNIPPLVLPKLVSSSGVVAECEIDELKGIPIAGIAGDQQAALFGQMCIRPGLAKNTYGTGCFMLLNTGEKVVKSKNKLLSTVAWKIGTEPMQYALEGGVFIGGALIQWLRDGLRIIRSSDEIEALAGSVKDSAGVVIVPAFVGLGAPHWNQFARGTIFGLTRGTTAAHIARAAEEAIALQVHELAAAMSKDVKVKLKELRVDGGAARDSLLMQIQADLLGIKVLKPHITETTALGAAYLAGLGIKVWKDKFELEKHWKAERIYRPKNNPNSIIASWKKAITRSLDWVD